MSDDMLEDIFETQTKLQVNAYGAHPGFFNDHEAIQFIKDMILALEDELHEALQEVGWKPWATSRHINRDAFAGELVDALHFLVNLALVIRMSPTELWTRYQAKAQKNLDRQQAGYDGVADKCPVCKRALDDDAVDCTPDECYAY